MDGAAHITADPLLKLKKTIISYHILHHYVLIFYFEMTYSAFSSIKLSSCMFESGLMLLKPCSNWPKITIAVTSDLRKKTKIPQNVFLRYNVRRNGAYVDQTGGQAENITPAAGAEP